jgi:hypothetical protein
MPKYTVFISYDYDHDRHYKNLLLAHLPQFSLVFGKD